MNLIELLFSKQLGSKAKPAFFKVGKEKDFATLFEKFLSKQDRAISKNTNTINIKNDDNHPKYSAEKTLFNLAMLQSKNRLDNTSVQNKGPIYPKIIEDKKSLHLFSKSYHPNHFSVYIAKNNNKNRAYRKLTKFTSKTIKAIKTTKAIHDEDKIVNDKKQILKSVAKNISGKSIYEAKKKESSKKNQPIIGRKSRLVKKTDKQASFDVDNKVSISIQRSKKIVHTIKHTDEKILTSQNRDTQRVEDIHKKNNNEIRRQKDKHNEMSILRTSDPHLSKDFEKVEKKESKRRADTKSNHSRVEEYHVDTMRSFRTIKKESVYTVLYESKKVDLSKKRNLDRQKPVKDLSPSKIDEVRNRYADFIVQAFATSENLQKSQKNASPLHGKIAQQEASSQKIFTKSRNPWQRHSFQAKKREDVNYMDLKQSDVKQTNHFESTLDPKYNKVPDYIPNHFGRNDTPHHTSQTFSPHTVARSKNLQKIKKSQDQSQKMDTVKETFGMISLKKSSKSNIRYETLIQKLHQDGTDHSFIPESSQSSTFTQNDTTFDFDQSAHSETFAQHIIEEEQHKVGEFQKRMVHIRLEHTKIQINMIGNQVNLTFSSAVPFYNDGALERFVDEVMRQSGFEHYKVRLKDKEKQLDISSANPAKSEDRGKSRVDVKV